MPLPALLDRLARLALVPTVVVAALLTPPVSTRGAADDGLSCPAALPGPVTVLSNGTATFPVKDGALKLASISGGAPTNQVIRVKDYPRLSFGAPGEHQLAFICSYVSTDAYLSKSLTDHLPSIVVTWTEGGRDPGRLGCVLNQSDTVSTASGERTDMFSISRQVQVSFRGYAAPQKGRTEEQAVADGQELTTSAMLRPIADRLQAAAAARAVSCDDKPDAGIAIDHLEVVQVVQDTKNSVPLVPGKKTVVRAFVRSTGKSPVPNVTGTLSISGARSSTVSSTGPISAPIAMDRANIGHSLIFVLPTALTAAGVYQYALSVTYPTLPSGAANNPDLKRTLGVTIAVNPRWPDLFTIGTLPLCIGPAEPSGQAGPWPVRPPRAGDECANEEKIAANDALLSKLFPAGPSGLWYTGISTPALTWTTPLSTSAARNRLLILLRKLYAGFVADGISLDQLVGWLPATADTRITDSRGTALGSVGGIADTAKVGGHAVWVVENSARDPRLPQFALPHELGHNLGLFHISPNDNPPVAKRSCGSVDTRSEWVDHFKDDAATIHEVGFDTEAMKVIPSTWFDLMSYCYPKSPDGSPSPGIWISAYQYQLLLGSDRAKSVAEAPLLALGDPASLAAAPRGDGLVISGTVRRDGSAGSLDPAYRVTNARLDVSAPKGDTCLRGDTGMSPFCFSLDFTEHTTNAPLDSAGFSFTVPIAPSLGSVSLTKGTRTVASLVGKPAPVVAITAPSVATPLSGTVALQWTAPGSLGTAVSYSPDGKHTWIPLAIDLTGQSLSVDTTKLLATSSLYFRVTASSGIVSASAESGPFTLTSGRSAGYPTRVAPRAGSTGTDRTQPGDTALGYGVLAALAAIVLGGIALLRRRGRRMVAAPVATPSPPAQSKTAAPPQAPAFCTSCGQPRWVGAKFCGSCGQPNG